jgi:hypothetical protein
VHRRLNREPLLLTGWSAVAATDDREQLAGPLIIVRGDELDERRCGDPPVRKATTYSRSRPHRFLRMVSPSAI